ncbi:MAG TPA: helix-turn-helix domain-containing protein [Woeseiaceae bacterium]
MTRYNQFCPVAKAAEVFCARWTPLILRELATGSTRFSQIQRGVPLASPTLISRRLMELEAEGVVERRQAAGGRGWTYHLTPAGEELVPIVTALGVWGQRWSRRELAENEMDLGLLLWALEKGAHPESFGPGRTIVELELVDQPARKRRWWFLNEDGRCELCLKRPDRDAQVYVVTSLPDLIRVWRGDVALETALATGRVKVHGSACMRRAFRRWLGICALAHVEPARREGASRAG